MILWQRPAVQQLGVLSMGTDLQGPDDNCRGHRPLGASQRDHRAEHSQLPIGDREEHAEAFRPGRFSAAVSHLISVCRLFRREI